MKKAIQYAAYSVGMVIGWAAFYVLFALIRGV